MNKLSPKITLAISLLLWSLLLFVWPKTQAEMLQLEIPTATEFDVSAGEQLPSPGSDIYYVGAADLNGDQLPDLLTAEDEGIKIYVNSLGKEEQTKGAFKQQSTSIALDNGYATLQGQHLEGVQDEDLDLVFFTKPPVEYVKQEKTGTVTGILGHDLLLDENASWRKDELKTLQLRPDATQEQSFKIEENLPEGEILPPLIRIADVKAEDPATWLDTYTQAGKTYAYQVWTQKQSQPSLLKIYLNEGDANFKEAECETSIKLENGRVVSRLAVGDYDRDGINDLAVLTAGGLTGKVMSYDWEEGQHGSYGKTEGRETSLFAKQTLEIPKAQAYDPARDTFAPPFRATITIQDPSYNFGNLGGLSGASLIPDINKNYAFTITSWNDNSVSAEAEIFGISSLNAGREILNSLTASGLTYAIKLGNFQELLFRGEGSGCYVPMQALTGDVYSLQYIEQENQPGSYWTELTDPAQSFGAEDGLVGRKVYFPMSVDELKDKRYTILHNTESALYIDTPEGSLSPFVSNYLGDGVSEAYLVDPSEEEFVFDESRVEIDKLNTAELPSSYLERINNLRTVDPPIKAAFADFNRDGKLDFVYANGYLFLKKNQA